MSDQVLSTEDLELLKLRDTRFAMLAQAIDVESELQNSAVIKTMMDAVRKDADQAMEDICDISPMDHAGMMLHLVKIRTLVYIRRTLNMVLQRGRVANQSIAAEDERRGNYERNDDD